MREVRLSDYIETRKAGHDRKARRFVLAALALGLLSVLLSLATSYYVAIVAFVPVFVLGIATAREKRWAEIFEIGIAGEKALAGALRQILDDQHIAFFNIPFAGAGDLDCLVVGPTGVKAIEVKNHNGVISLRNGAWRQVKTGRGGTRYAGSIRNPSKQLAASIRRLKDQLVRGGIDKVWIEAAIVFANPKARLGQIEMDPSRLRVLTLSALPHLFAGGRRIDKKTQDHIEACIGIEYLSEQFGVQKPPQIPSQPPGGGNIQAYAVPSSGSSLNTATRHP